MVQLSRPCRIDCRRGGTEEIDVHNRNRELGYRDSLECG
jgi:hypothetical protein